MKYFKLALKTTSEDIKANTTKIRLKDYDYDSTVAAMNTYFYRNLEADICFLAYRDKDKNEIPSVFSYDDRTLGYDESYACVTDFLKNIFSVNSLSKPSEITAQEFYDCLQEGSRRGLIINTRYRWIDTAKLDYSEYVRQNEKKNPRFNLQEKIIPEDALKSEDLFDESVKAELKNIADHPNTSELVGNIVHYFISSKSIQAAADITEALMHRLIKAKRLNGRHMQIISGISPELYRGDCYFEELIENNFDGVTVIDLSEKFGCSSTEYGKTCKYIENIIKQYKNDSLFVFTYNPDAPGFAYELLRSISREIIPVMLKEGSGKRADAVKYMKTLIKASDYSQYAEQAGEFMKLYPGKEFSQTDVLTAFENFESWCINKNILSSAYGYTHTDDFMLDRKENDQSSYEKLHRLVGLETVKKQIDRIITTNIVEKERKKRAGKICEDVSMHMIFGGDPGTSKTTVAKLLAGIAKEKGILKSGTFVCIGGNDLWSNTLDDAFKKAEGGVLFIDEAYAMYPSTIITLLQRLEDKRDSVIVILAGYKDVMLSFLEKNAGLKSRIPYFVDFPNYSADELTEIFKNMVKERGFEMEKEVLNKAHLVFEKALLVDNFGNGRYVRTFLDGVLQNQSFRLAGGGKDIEKVRKKDLFLIKCVDIDMQEEGMDGDAKPGEAQKELDDMIGLDSAKKILRKVIASAKMKKIYLDNGITNNIPSLHMMFTGNPGTSKTSAARLFAKIMKDEKILARGNFVEVGRADLVGQFVGQTAPLVRQQFKKAQGGELFIDEAYSLCDGYKGGYGDEAINTIVQEMENHRDDVIVIFAGYSDQMNEFIERNPGMSSRIKFKVEFEDYTTDELCDITKLMLSKMQMEITDPAMEKLKVIYEEARKDKSFGNGRFVRQMLENAKMNLAERILKLEETQLTPQVITTIEEDDITVTEIKSEPVEKGRIGF